jgi:anti-sigma regulatory factor (Ser/Thr protein kinase)
MDRSRSLQLERQATAAALLRRWLEAEFSDVISGPRLAELQLVGTELVTNALQHGDGQVSVRVVMSGHALVIEVVDEGEGNVPSIRAQPADESGGWGLQIVERLAVAWGAYAGTTHIWAELPVEPPE